MNLFHLHEESNQLNHFHDIESVPLLAWEKYWESDDELKKREKLWARDAKTAYLYAEHILKGPFPLGEPVIAKSAEWSYLYACYVLNAPFPLGEPAIETDYYHSQLYFSWVNWLNIRIEERILNGYLTTDPR